MRRLLSLLLIIASGYGAIHAVTPDEMEQARAIAAKEYLRWANDGSGYLDEIKQTPTSLAELEKNLKAKEKENIRSFKAVKVPGDYASWDKEALVKYWSETFFASPGLIEKGKAAKGRVKSRIQKMTVSAPAAAAAKPSAPADGAPVPDLDPVETSPAQAAPAADSAALAAEAMAVAADALAADSAAAEVADTERKSAGSSVWIYVVALCVLVGVVIWLVIFASKTMKSSEDYPEVEEGKRRLARRSRAEDTAPADDAAVVIDGVADLPQGEEMAVATGVSDARLREKFAESLARKNEEIRSLNRQLIDLREECFKLGEENGRLVSELEAAHREIDELNRRPEPRVAPAAPAAATEEPEATPRRRRPAAAREIYLGRVNAKGLFVRADREMVEGKSVYRLSTTDGYTGTFRVVTDECMMDTMLDNPQDYLAGGCVAKDLEDTDGMMEIVTESAGTAIFEDGCWRVLRKAKIAYK